MKRKWKKILWFVFLWLLFPVVLICAIQEEGTLVMKKEESVEEILPFLVAASISNGCNIENTKAMAVIWRSNVVYLLDGGKIAMNDLKIQDEMLLKERYLKKKELYQAAIQACRETEGEVMTYEKNVCYCPFFYASNGKTRDAFEFFQKNQYPYLISVPSYRDEESEDFLSYEYYSIEELYEAIFPRGEVKRSETEPLEGHIQILETDSAGYVLWIKVGNRVMGGEHFRRALQLNSSCFTIEEKESEIRIICKGVGHGFGYSQYGGDQMAKAGKNYNELLKHYFPELDIGKDV